MTNRAARGGQVGTNGEFYEGGKFLPSTKAPKRHRATRSGMPRVLVEPGIIATIPAGHVAIFPQIREFVTFVGGEAVAKFSDDHRAVQSHWPEPARLHALIAKFNAYARHYPAHEEV